MSIVHPLLFEFVFTVIVIVTLHFHRYITVFYIQIESWALENRTCGC